MPRSPIAFLSLAAALAFASGTVAHAQQQEKIRITAGGTSGTVRVIATEPTRPSISGIVANAPVIDGLDVRRTPPMLTGPMAHGDIMEEEHGDGVDQANHEGLSNTFFIRRLVDGTLDMSPALGRPSASVDTWTEQVLTGQRQGGDTTSPVEAWTETVYGDGQP